MTEQTKDKEWVIVETSRRWLLMLKPKKHK
jgi:hypothetical protein